MCLSRYLCQLLYVLPMTSSGVLCLLGALCLQVLWLQLSGAQGAPNPDNSHSSSPAPPQTPQHLSQKSPKRDTLKPAAHLVGDPSTQDSIHWRASTDHAFLRHGFSLSNNSLLVPTSGLYFVYSQVVFSGASCSSEITPTLLYLSHEVLLFSSKYQVHVPLLSAQKSVCPGTQGPWMRSVYQGAVFLLTQGDLLSTHTDGVSHLLQSPSSVFFGAFAL
ncbi:lymphotoxin-alpha isoform X2 [Vombatus ursinus]|uniref:lymphotoxin-alpha isoform X2 n=1 Tax=Vombatus ursinus TaxID=29139 RepID=UPI000FFD25ED|nr:lymphotoxin-alpha isoform X2 [Vombatus ursinus]XP_027713072.1 lymphotoxin-alpha isoform X2 [Vombatus ursinus]XP_027713926.1 lymphotoxin-alpha isoform X2 [Vombatus ursinus]XP_027713930.1 lymphotoxin-alpha isoform X2 [Vombatus ursinus]XP_027732280.1 lymphotoxin-alpha isoform X2 [Vombatus ursinus]